MSSPIINLDEEGEGDINNEESEVEEETPTSRKSKRTRVQAHAKGKKPKTSSGRWSQQHMGELMAMNERAAISCESAAMASRETNSDISINFNNVNYLNNVYHYVVYNDLLSSLTNIFDMTVPQMMIAYVMMNNGEQRQYQ